VIVQNKNIFWYILSFVKDCSYRKVLVQNSSKKVENNITFASLYVLKRGGQLISPSDKKLSQIYKLLLHDLTYQPLTGLCHFLSKRNLDQIYWD
jgi:hypothetical protein